MSMVSTEVLWEKETRGRWGPEWRCKGRDRERFTNHVKALCLTQDSKSALIRGEITIMPLKPSNFLFYLYVEP